MIRRGDPPRDRRRVFAHDSVVALVDIPPSRDVIRLVQVKISEDIIISKIRHSKTRFDASIDNLVALKEAGVSDSLIEVMMNPTGRECLRACPIGNSGRAREAGDPETRDGAGRNRSEGSGRDRCGSSRQRCSPGAYRAYAGELWRVRRRPWRTEAPWPHPDQGADQQIPDPGEERGAVRARQDRHQYPGRPLDQPFRNAASDVSTRTSRRAAT